MNPLGRKILVGAVLAGLAGTLYALDAQDVVPLRAAIIGLAIGMVAGRVVR